MNALDERDLLRGNMVDIALHMDENSPHMHVLFVPMVEGRLCAKEVTSRAEMVRRQTSYAGVMEQFGLKRGDSAAETHRRHVRLKDKPSAAGGKALQERIAALEKSLAELTSRGAFLEGRRQAAAREVTALMAERDALAKERDGLKAELEKALDKEKVEERGPVSVPVIADTTEQERAALLEQFKPVREANPSDLPYGKVVGAVEGLAVLSMGRGVYVSHKLDAGPLPAVGSELNEQRRGGVAR